MKIASRVLQAALLATTARFSTSQTFVPYYTSVDVYLDPTTSGGMNIDNGQGTVWELSSAVNRGNCVNHRRDFIFHCGWYADLNGSGQSGWSCSGSNNSIGNPLVDITGEYPPYEIFQAGWYTFQHVFNDVGGILSVDLNILDSSGTLLNSRTLSTLADEINPAVIDEANTPGIGGNRYGWFVRIGCHQRSGSSCVAFDEMFELPIDNAQKCIQGCDCDFFQGFEENIDGWGYSGLPASLIMRVASDPMGIQSASGDFHAIIVPNDGARGPFTDWGGYCTTGSFPCPPSDVCTATCDVPVKVSGICELDVILKCDPTSKFSDSTPTAVVAEVQCGCADTTARAPREEGEENFCLSLQGGSCAAQLDTVGKSGAVQCVQDGVTYSLIASVSGDDTFKDDFLEKVVDPEECQLS